jgi:hydroxypyruvate reductase
MADAFLAAHRSRVREVLVASGAHPLPDAASVESARGALRIAADARARGECLIVLLSGGASAMLALPADGLSLEDKIATTRLLLKSGLPIAEMNAVRKHVSAIKGGQLAAAAGHSHTFAISDVHAPVEDDPATIGSGPTVADPSTFDDAIVALRRAGLWEQLAAAVAQRLTAGARGVLPETMKRGDSRLASAMFTLAGSRRDAMDGAAREAATRGYRTIVLDRPTVGEARDAAIGFAREADAVLRSSARPACIIASGETTVTIVSGGVGGRNQEFALAAAPHLGGVGNFALASVGTDGIDGPTDAAGAIADATTLERARQRSLDATRALDAHDAYPFFDALGDLVVTGATGTNVGDLQILLVE